MEEKQVQEQDLDQVQGKDQDIDNSTDESTDLEAKLQLLEKQAEMQKREIAGLNRKNSTLEKEKEELELSKMEESEKKQREIELAEERLKKIQAETEEMERNKIIAEQLSDAGLPYNVFAKRITGKTAEEISEDVKEFKEFFYAEVTKAKKDEINQTLGGKSPDSGAAPEAGLQAEYDKAKAKGDFALMTAIKRKASAEGVEIKSL
jgi:DNA repair exonuclease SbcCD ATPase subunit